MSLKSVKLARLMGSVRNNRGSSSPSTDLHDCYVKIFIEMFMAALILKNKLMSFFYRSIYCYHVGPICTYLCLILIRFWMCNV